MKSWFKNEVNIGVEKTTLPPKEMPMISSIFDTNNTPLACIVNFVTVYINNRINTSHNREQSRPLKNISIDSNKSHIPIGIQISCGIVIPSTVPNRHCHFHPKHSFEPLVKFTPYPERWFF